jgi:hypothetical protein
VFICLFPYWFLNETLPMFYKTRQGVYPVPLMHSRARVTEPPTNLRVWTASVGDPLPPTNLRVWTVSVGDPLIVE